MRKTTTFTFIFLILFCYRNIVNAQSKIDTTGGGSKQGVNAQNQTSTGGGGGADPGTAPSPLDFAKLRTDILPHSPEAEAMAKYDALPVTLYTGMPGISIPIYDVKAGSLDLPFSLSFNQNGYRPNEVASFVGLGWSVQGAGAITRSVKGKVDESYLPNGRYEDFVNPTGIYWSQDFLRDVGIGNVDIEPDLYTFNFGGYSGKFIIIKSKAYLFPSQNLAITKVGNTEFDITDEKGNKYLFYDDEVTNHNATTGEDVVDDHVSTWYISKVVSADKIDTVYFNYSDYTYRQSTSFMDVYSVDSRSENNSAYQTFNTVPIHGDRILAKLLSSVVWKSGAITFLASSDRQDMSGSTGGKMLDEINVTNSDVSNIKRLVLQHDYFGSGTTSRLRLKKVVIKPLYSTGGTPIDTSFYKFEYYAGKGIAAYGSKSIDYWGYYNGADNSMLIPAGYFNALLAPPADRNPDTSYSTLGLMKKLTYPTGGYSYFSYEQNKRGNSGSSATYVDRIIAAHSDIPNPTKIIKDTFNINGSQDVQISTVCIGLPNSSGPTYSILNIYSDLSCTHLIYWSPIINSTDGEGTGSTSSTFHLNAGTYVFTIKADISFPNTHGTIKFKFYTSHAPTIEEAPGLRIKQIRFFGDLSGTTPSLVKNYSYDDGMQVIEDGVKLSTLYHDCSDFTVYTYQSVSGSPTSDLINNPFYYQTVTETSSDSTKTGKTVYHYNSPSEYLSSVNLISDTEYIYSTSHFYPVKSTSNKYLSSVKNTFNTFQVEKTVIVGSGSVPACQLLQSTDETQADAPSELYSAKTFYSYDDIYTRLIKKETTSYNIAGSVKLLDSTNYFYDNPDYTWSNRTVTHNSKGEQITEELKFPLDYNFGSCSTRTTMDTTFMNNVMTAVSNASVCHGDLQRALDPYISYSSHPSEYVTINSTYPCVASFKSAMATVLTDRNNAGISYNTCLNNAIANNAVAWKKAVLWMQQNNVLSTPIEKYISIKKSDGNDYLLQATRNEYSIFNSQASILGSIAQTEITQPLLKSTFLANTDTYYKPQVSFGYDNNLNLISQLKQKDVPHSYIWGYNGSLPIAEVANALWSKIAYTSFEEDGGGDWSIGSTIRLSGDCVTGNQYYQLSNGAITKGNLTPTFKYIVSYWTQNQNALTIANATPGVRGRTHGTWTYYQHVDSLPASVYSVTIPQVSATIDDLRLYPADAQMTTYTYEPLLGMTSQADASSHITYYEYDDLSRLSLTRDQDGNILKMYQYGLVAANPASGNLCSSSNCNGVDEKCINGFCEKAVRINPSTVYIKSGTYKYKWKCTFYYQWSNGNTSATFTEYNDFPCDINVTP